MLNHWLERAAHVPAGVVWLLAVSAVVALLVYEALRAHGSGRALAWSRPVAVVGVPLLGLFGLAILARFAALAHW